MNETKQYDVAVIGAGAAGMAAALAAAERGADTVIIERGRLCGESLWSGSVPRQTLAKSARAHETIKRAEEFGVHVEATRVVWGAVRMRIAAVRDDIKALQRARLEKAGVTIMAGAARFVDAHMLAISGKSGETHIAARSIIIATGAGAVNPESAGLEEAGYLTPATVFDATPLPRSLVIIGGGAVACEFAQALQRMGSKVTLLMAQSMLLPEFDSEIAERAERLLTQEGVVLHCHVTVVGAGSDDQGKWVEWSAADGDKETTRATQILILPAQVPNCDGLDLAAAGVEYSATGIVVDKHLRTTAPHIFACGAVIGQAPDDHTVDYDARLAITNALTLASRPRDVATLPAVVFTDPEIATVGLSEAAARKHGATTIYHADFAHLERAVIDGEASGLMKIVADADDIIVGAHFVGPAAGELIHLAAAAMQQQMLAKAFCARACAVPTLSSIGRHAVIRSDWV